MPGDTVEKLDHAPRPSFRTARVLDALPPVNPDERDAEQSVVA